MFKVIETIKMITQTTQNEKTLALVEKMGILRPRDLARILHEFT